jgi:hypothetical protein
MLGAPGSPMLEIRLRETKSAGLAVWLPLSGRGLTGLITPDICVFGVGGSGLRLAGIGLCVCCNDAGTRGPSGFGDGLLNSASSVFFWSAETDCCRSKGCSVVADGAGDWVKGITGWIAGCGEGLLNMSRRLFACAVGAGTGPDVWLLGRFRICGLNAVGGASKVSVLLSGIPLRPPILTSKGLRDFDCSRFNICCGTNGEAPRELLLMGIVCFFIVSKSGALTGPRTVAEVIPAGLG